MTDADADRFGPAVQPLGEVVDPRQRRGAGGRSNGEKVLGAETESLESCRAVTFMPPSTASMPMGRCYVSRRFVRDRQFIICAFPRDPQVSTRLPTEHATVTNGTLRFPPARLSRTHVSMSLPGDPFVKTFGDRREFNASTPASARNR
jgi:hypothetical protein